MFSDKPFMHGIVAVVVGVALSLASIVVVGLKKHVFFFFFFFKEQLQRRLYLSLDVRKGRKPPYVV